MDIPSLQTARAAWHDKQLRKCRIALPNAALCGFARAVEGRAGEANFAVAICPPLDALAAG